MLIEAKKALFLEAAACDHGVGRDDSMGRKSAKKLGHCSRGHSKGTQGSSSRAQDMASGGQEDDVIRAREHRGGGRGSVKGPTRRCEGRA